MFDDLLSEQNHKLYINDLFKIFSLLLSMIYILGAIGHNGKTTNMSSTKDLFFNRNCNFDFNGKNIHT